MRDCYIWRFDSHRVIVKYYCSSKCIVLIWTDNCTGNTMYVLGVSPSLSLYAVTRQNGLKLPLNLLRFLKIRVTV